MRILWHGVAPWQPTGYGQQAAIWARKLRDAGHEVAIGAQGGNDNCQVWQWEGIPVLPQAKDVSAVWLVMQRNLAQVQPDLVITCYDPWQMGAGGIWQGHKVFAWLPIDTTTLTLPGGEVRGEGMNISDIKWLEDSGASPVAMSRHGKKMLEHAGWQDPPLIPHAIHARTVFTPPAPEERARVRGLLGIPDGTFAVGIMAMNNDRHRKALDSQLIAFAKFHAKHPDSLLFMHSQVYLPAAVSLSELGQYLGLGDGTHPDDILRLADQYHIFTGTFPPAHLASWYGAMDVVMNCSMGEGFGIAAIEAQACGTPVILNNAHTGPELAGPGWLVSNQEFWNERHRGMWWAPNIHSMYQTLCKARVEAAGKREAAREFGLRFDVDEVWPLWEKLLAEV